MVVALAVVGLVLGRPPSGAGSTALTATARTADVAVTVTASGSLADQYTYSIAAGTTPVLTASAGTASAGTASAGTASGGTAAGGSSAGTSSAAGSTSTAGGGSGYTTRSISVSPGQAVSKDQRIAVARDAAGKDHDVETPVAGHVRTISTAVGASASSVATIGAGRTLAAVDVDENQIAEVRSGQTARVTFGTGGGTVTGTVGAIAQTADDSSGVKRYRVLVQPESVPSGSRIGMTVTVTIDIERHDDVVTVPASAVTERNGHDTVQVVGANGVATTARVEVGLTGDSAVEIVSGLRAGQKVVIGQTGSVPASTGPRAPGAP